MQPISKHKEKEENMKRIKIVLALLACAIMAQAGEYAYLVFVNTAGTTTALSVSNMTLSVSSSELTVTNADGSQVFTLTDLAAMQFSKDGNITALENVLNGEQPVEAFTVTGVGVGRFDNLREAAGRLPAGTYVIKQGSSAQTVIIR